MHELGHTRSAHRHNHLLLTPDTFVRAPLPGMRNAAAIIHVAPAAGARFTEFTAEFEEGGLLGPAAAQRFVYVIEGELEMNGRALAAGVLSRAGRVSLARNHWKEILRSKCGTSFLTMRLSTSL